MKQKKEIWESYLGGQKKKKIPCSSNSDYCPAKRQSFGRKFLLLPKSQNQTSIADVEHKAERIALKAQESIVAMLKRRTYSSFLVKDPRGKSNPH